VLAVVHREVAAGYVASQGADLVVPLADGWAERVRECTHGRGVDSVVDAIGGPAFDDAIRVLAIDGKLLVIGFAAGSIPTVKVNRLLLRNVSVMGVAWGEYLNKVPGSAALFSWGLSQLVFLGLKPPPPQRYPLSDRPRCRAWPTAECSARWCSSRSSVDARVRCSGQDGAERVPNCAELEKG
jgi:NADPH2:quinone reductase